MNLTSPCILLHDQGGAAGHCCCLGYETVAMVTNSSILVRAEPIRYKTHYHTLLYIPYSLRAERHADLKVAPVMQEHIYYIREYMYNARTIST